ncbi:MAG: helix-turn-helix domain-containing protein [Clostridia bacterium]|nr:helix-turn-helix domain-containing protein [Clostridia bacterium]
MHDIGNRIITLRKEFNMSQEVLAERVGVSRQAISKWERGEATPDIYNITALADIFQLSIDEFIRGEEFDFKSKKPKIIAIELKKNAEKLIMLAIAIFIVSAFGFTVLPFSNDMNLLIFGLMIAAGILIIIRGGFMFERFYMYNKAVNQKEYNASASNKTLSKKRKNAIGTIVSILCTMIYLYISFIYGLWHPGWLVFLVIPIAYAVFDIFETD